MLATALTVLTVLTAGLGAPVQPAAPFEVVRLDRPMPPGGPGGARGSCVYQSDDGTVESHTYYVGGELAWIHRYDAAPGRERIVSVSTAWGNDLPAGRDARVFVWEDPDDDGNPDDAVLLREQHVTVQNPGMGIPVEYTLADPVDVEGAFFVGAAVLVEGVETEVCPLDDSSGYIPGSTWLGADDTEFDPQTLANNTLPPADYGPDFGYTILRACGVSAIGITYQGRLDDDGQAADGPADMRFALYDAPSGGVQVGVLAELPGVDVNEGVFSVELPFGGADFGAAPRWLEVSVAFPSGGAYTTLLPRQPITPAPQAHHAASADSAATLTGSVDWSQLTGVPVIADGHSLDALDGFPEDVVRVDSAGRVGINTSAPAATLHVTDPGNGNLSVILPIDAVGAAEILDEPGVASAALGASVIMDGTLQVLTSRSITAPGPGYVLVIGTCQATTSHTAGTTTQINFGVSDTASSLPSNQDVSLALSSSLPSGIYILPVTVHGMFSVAAGINTFYLLGDEFVGDCTVFDIQFSLLYVPTAYGLVSPTLRGGGDVPDYLAPVRGGLSPREVHAEQAEAAAFDQRRVMEEIAMLRKEVARLRARQDRREEHE